MRYFGVGIEGWVGNAHQELENIFIDHSDNISLHGFNSQNNTVGAVLGTLTLRYPIPCSRFAPYIFGGGGGIFGGGQRQVNERFVEPGEGFDILATTGHTDAEARAIGQVGGGMEYEHLDFPAAVHKLATRAGITIVEERGAADENRQYETRRKLVKLHDFTSQ